MILLFGNLFTKLNVIWITYFLNFFIILCIGGEKMNSLWNLAYILHKNKMEDKMEREKWLFSFYKILFFLIIKIYKKFNLRGQERTQK